MNLHYAVVRPERAASHGHDAAEKGGTGITGRARCKRPGRRAGTSRLAAGAPDHGHLPDPGHGTSRNDCRAFAAHRVAHTRTGRGRWHAHAPRRKRARHAVAGSRADIARSTAAGRPRDYRGIRPAWLDRGDQGHERRGLGRRSCTRASPRQRHAAMGLHHLQSVPASLRGRANSRRCSMQSLQAPIGSLLANRVATGSRWREVTWSARSARAL